MCNPALAVMAVSMAISMATTVMANNRQNEMIEQDAENAVKKSKFDYDMLTNQAQDVNDASAQEKLQRQLQTARQRGQIAVAQGAAGVGGNSSLAVMNNTIMQERMDLDVLESNRMGQVRQINSTMQGMGINITGDMANAEAASLSQTSQGISAGLAGAQGAMSGYSMGKSFGSTTPKKIPAIPQGRWQPRTG